MLFTVPTLCKGFTTNILESLIFAYLCWKFSRKKLYLCVWIEICSLVTFFKFPIRELLIIFAPPLYLCLQINHEYLSVTEKIKSVSQHVNTYYINTCTGIANDSIIVTAKTCCLKVQFSRMHNRLSIKVTCA